MATKVERLNSLPVTERGTYLFFQHPPELWISEHAGHAGILEESGRQVTHDTIAGGFTHDKKIRMTVFDGMGSSSIGINRCNASPVVKHVKRLPGFSKWRVDAI